MKFFIVMSTGDCFGCCCKYITNLYSSVSPIQDTLDPNPQAADLLEPEHADIDAFQPEPSEEGAAVFQNPISTQHGLKADLSNILLREDVDSQIYIGSDRSEHVIKKIEEVIETNINRPDDFKSKIPLTSNYSETDVLIIPIKPFKGIVEGMPEDFIVIDNFFILERRGNDWYYVKVDDPARPAEFVDLDSDPDHDINNALWYLVYKKKYDPNLAGLSFAELELLGDFFIIKKLNVNVAIVNSTRAFGFLGYNKALMQDGLIKLCPVFKEIQSLQEINKEVYEQLQAAMDPASPIFLTDGNFDDRVRE